MTTAIDKAKLFEAIGYRPHPRQLGYHASDARFRLAVCGRRFGKSRMAAADREASLLDPLNPVRGWIVAPTYRLGEKEFRYLWNDIIIKLGLGAKIKRKAYNVRSGEMYIEFPWGSRIDVMSADHPDGLVGEGLHWVIMAEAAKLDPSIWSKYIRPALADYRGGADFVTTPEGYNWIKDLADYAKTAEATDWEFFHFPAWENPYVYPLGEQDPEIIDERENNPTVVFDQEIGAKFTALAGRIYDEFDEELHTDDWQYDSRIPNYLAIDFGYTNPFVALDVQITPSDEVHVWREYYVTHTPTHQHVAELLNRSNPPGYKIAFATADAADPGGVQTIQDGLGIHVLAEQDYKDWSMGVTQIKNLLKPDNPRLFIAKSCEKTIWEFNNYRTKEGQRISVSSNQDERPQKWADHSLDAIRYLVMARFVYGAGYHLSDLADVYQPPNPEVEYAFKSEEDLESEGIFTLNSNIRW